LVSVRKHKQLLQIQPCVESAVKTQLTITAVDVFFGCCCYSWNSSAWRCCHW